MEIIKCLVGSKDRLNSLAKRRGQLIITTGTKEVYFDVDNTTRIKLGYSADEVDFMLSGKVSSERTVNGKPLSADVVLDAGDVGARPDTWMPTASDVGAAPAQHSHDDYLPKAGGTMTGSLIGQSNANYTVAQMRNVAFVTQAQLNALTITAALNGTIYLVYS